MANNSLKISWRILTRYKVNTIINITGMIVAFAAAILIITFILHELRFDKFHEKGDRIYRLNSQVTMADGQEMKAVTTTGKLPPILEAEMPEIEHITRVYNWGNNELNIDGTLFNTEDLLWVDPSFFNIFSFDIIAGNRNSCLQDPYSLVLSESMSKKLFGEKNSINKGIIINEKPFIVKAIMKDVPTTSHLQFEILASFSSIETPEYSVTDRNGLSFPFYLLLKEGVNFNTFLPKYKKISNAVTEARFRGTGFKVVHDLQPMNKVHLYSDHHFDTAKVTDIKNIWIFSILVVFILLIASVNYVNLMTAQSEIRMRESGLRKVLGANRSHLIRQFLLESMLICMTALIIAFGIAEIFIKPFGNLVNADLDFSSVTNYMVILIMFLLTIVTSILAGFYPAWIVSVSQPVLILKGSKGNKSVGTFGKFLVSFQFGVTVFLIISVLLINLQIKYMKTKDLGFDKTNRIVAENLTDDIRSSYASLRAKLLTNPKIVNVTCSQAVPGSNMNIQNCHKKGDDPNTAFMINEARVGDYFIETFGMKILKGRSFDPELSTDSDKYIINEAAAKKLGLKDPIGHKILVWRIEGTVIGVVSDFHFTSMHQQVEPLVLSHYEPYFERIAIEYEGDTKQALNYIEKVFKDTDTKYNFDYSFTDQTFAKMYDREEKFNDLIISGSVIAIIISVMGLFALTSFSIRRRVKEIGIRKTLGATVNQILYLLSSKILYWIIPGVIIAFPLAWWAIDKWLQNFAYHISLVYFWWVWIAGSMIALIVGLLAVYFQAVKAANANPVESLKYE